MPIGVQQFWSGILTSLVASALFAVVVAFVTRAYSRFTSGNPRHRRTGLATATVAWALSNLIYGYFHFTQYGFRIYLVCTTLIFGWVLYRELYQFWRIGLVGADAEVRKGINYSRALRLCSNSMDFLGIGASKLSDKAGEFRDAIDRCNRPDRPIRFLLSSPENESLKSIAKSAGQDPAAYQRRVSNSLRVIADLRTSRAKHIQVRFYNQIPAFRLMFINDEICLASHYVLGKGDGSQLPQLHIVKTSGSQDVNSLFYGFVAYFETIWRESEEWDFESYLEPKA
jgi:hypothetical protein